MRLQVIATGSSGNCYALHDGGKILLLDAGITGTKILKAINYRIGDVVGCLITHHHQDHCKAVQELSRKGVTFYGTVDTAKDVPGLRTSSGAFRMGQFLCLPFKVEHINTDGTDCPNCGWLITNNSTKERMAYITDTCTLHNTLPGIHYWLIECNYMDELLQGSHPVLIERLPKSHMSLKKLCEVFAANDLEQCKQIVLCHGSNERLDPEIAKKTVMAATVKQTVVATAGLMVELGIEPY